MGIELREQDKKYSDRLLDLGLTPSQAIRGARIVGTIVRAGSSLDVAGIVTSGEYIGDTSANYNPDLKVKQGEVYKVLINVMDGLRDLSKRGVLEQTTDLSFGISALHRGLLE
jgi:hypothetical protein